MSQKIKFVSLYLGEKFCSLSYSHTILVNILLNLLRIQVNKFSRHPLMGQFDPFLLRKLICAYFIFIDLRIYSKCKVRSANLRCLPQIRVRFEGLHDLVHVFIVGDITLE